MSNMPHAMYRNTLQDLRDCQENLDIEPEHDAERRARVALVKLCIQIASDYADEVAEMDPKTDDALAALANRN